MSLRAILWVLDNSEATLGARLVLIALAEYAREDGTNAWPSVESICRKAKMSRKGVQDALRRLERGGLIVPTGDSESGTRIYAIAGVVGEGGEVTTPLGGEATTPPGGEDDAPGGAKMLPVGGEVTTPDPTTGPKNVSQELAVRSGAEAAPREASPLWDVLVDLYDDPLPRFKAGRGRIVADLRDLLVRDGVRDADRAVAEVRRRQDALIREWGEAKATARALVQNWALAGKLADGRARRAAPPSREDRLTPEEMIRRARDLEDAGQ